MYRNRNEIIQRLAIDYERPIIQDIYKEIGFVPMDRKILYPSAALDPYTRVRQWERQIAYTNWPRLEARGELDFLEMAALIVDITRITRGRWSIASRISTGGFAEVQTAFKDERDLVLLGLNFQNFTDTARERAAEAAKRIYG